MRRCQLAGFALIVAAAALPTPAVTADELATDRPVGDIETVATFHGPMPTGVTVSHSGRIFVCFPKWGDKIDFTVAELKDGRPIAFPDEEINRAGGVQDARHLISVQSVVIDPNDRLWIVDTGSILFGPTSPGGPKLVGVDLRTNRVIKTVNFPPEVALPTTYLNDVRFDLRRGTAGYAFLTDSSDKGPNGIIVVDLATGTSWRRLHDHPSTKAHPATLALVEGRPVMERPPLGKPKPVAMGSDGIAISYDGSRLYYCPLVSRRLYSVSVDALSDTRLSDSQVAATVYDHGEKGLSDGLESDDKGRIYATNYEQNGILRRGTDGSYETLVHDPRVLWPDTLSVARDGHLYFTANQLHRQAKYNEGKDLRQKPYVLFRVRIDGGPVRLAAGVDSSPTSAKTP
jgi:sugar lactone lactonase YvrE